MKKLLIFAIVLIISIMIFSSLPSPAPVSAQTRYKVSGYILDSNGHGLAGANVIFNVPQVVPSYTSNGTGYYEMLAPTGTYHVNVWPPYNSTYLNYDEPGFVVNSNIPKNITLTAGCKVSGYVTNSSGTPMVGASVLFKVGSTVYGSGYFTNYAGYYYIAVPSGTYTIDAHPQTAYDPNFSGPCTYFPTYTQNNFAVNGDLSKNITVGPPVANKVSGYILDSDGHRLAGAMVIFNEPSIIPAVYSDNSGYYQSFAPSGTYHINVWPPYNTNYMSYDEAALTVDSDITKNITLETGYKVYGFVTDSHGTPMVGAVVALNDYYSGWYTNNTGYYFVSVPAGTYTIQSHPRVGTFSGPTSNFPTYYEYNFVVNANILKDIIVTSQTTPAPTSNPTSQPNPTTNPTSTPSHNPTPNPTLPPTQISIQTDASSFKVGQKLTVEGTLTDQNGHPLSDKTVVLSYSISNGGSWFDIGSGKTNQAGEYSIQWLIDASGTFNLKAVYAGDSSLAGSEDTVTLSFLPVQDKNVFFVESNSTVTGLDFNSAKLELGFTVSGPSGTQGHTAVTIADSLVANFTGFTVSLDGKQIDYTVTDSGDYWVLSFNYSHSTHQVTVGLNAEVKQSQISIDTTILLAVSATIIALAIGGVFAFRRAHKKP
jgi:protocatechuate 3,4-dioxygenase beta subunit